MSDAASPAFDSSWQLRQVVLEVERHAAEAGWDQAARLFALVSTHELAAAEPVLAAELGISATDADGLTPVEQELEDPSESLEELLIRIMWPVSVTGALAVVERLVLPPEAEVGVPDDPAAAVEFAAGHLLKEDVRIAVGVDRGGHAYCVLRMRSHDDDDSVLEGADLVPDLVGLLRETLEADV